MKRIILIGGGPTAGKSTLAAALSKQLDLPWIGSDQIRAIMRLVASRQDHPHLFQPLGADTAEKFLSAYNTQEIVDLEIRQSAAVWPTVKQFIDQDYTWTDGMIIEGVNLLPEFVARDFGDDPRVKAVFVFDQDPERTRQVIFSRGLWAQATDYSDEVKEKEVAWSLLCGETIRRQAEKLGLPRVDVTKSPRDIQLLLKALRS